jgi:CheY-like chemotaxis protein
LSAYTFTIYLPAARGLEVYQSQIREKPRPVKGRETILVVDDDENISALTKTILAHLGYKTLSAPDGESALQIYADKQYEIDLVLLDLGMPGMGGAKCLEKLIQMDPIVKVVIASGYTEDGLVKDRVKQGAKASIIKPYTIEKFSKILRSVLDDHPV